MDTHKRKHTGAYYTPDVVVRSLVRWAAHSQSDRLLDPACGDGRFLAAHPNSVGVEQDSEALAIVRHWAPGSVIHQGDFFAWASATRERFECAAGNPPFIRYQRFAGSTRARALELCARHGANFSGLTSSWAPFLVAAAALLKPAGRMAFVVPAEIGHAPYAKPLLDYLTRNFELVQVIAVREKLFPELSEDCWLLHAQGFGGQTSNILFSALQQFAFTSAPPDVTVRISLAEWRLWNSRLRPFLLSSDARATYRDLAETATRLGDLARVGIGYVTGANEFFHLRPSDARRRKLPREVLRPAVRSGKVLTGRAITPATVEGWRRRDAPVLLLDLGAYDELPTTVRQYLDSPEGQAARTSYKCRNRTPWYVVPDVTVPDAFLSYMSGDGPALVANRAGCVGTNSVHVVRMRPGASLTDLQRAWAEPLTRLSCEVEGHPLGGGVLKLEPGEAARIMLSYGPGRSRIHAQVIADAINAMKQWRHHA